MCSLYTPDIARSPTAIKNSETVHLYQNERYIPLNGWSTNVRAKILITLAAKLIIIIIIIICLSKNLLLTDRKPFSTMDGSTGWSSLTEASDSLLSKGDT